MNNQMKDTRHQKDIKCNITYQKQVDNIMAKTEKP